MKSRTHDTQRVTRPSLRNETAALRRASISGYTVIVYHLDKTIAIQRERRTIHKRFALNPYYSMERKVRKTSPLILQHPQKIQTLESYLNVHRLETKQIREKLIPTHKEPRKHEGILWQFPSTDLITFITLLELSNILAIYGSYLIPILY